LLSEVFIQQLNNLFYVHVAVHRAVVQVFTLQCEVPLVIKTSV